MTDVAIITRDIETAGGTEWVVGKQAQELDADIYCTGYNKEIYPDLYENLDIFEYDDWISLPLFEITLNRYNLYFNPSSGFLEDYDVIIAHKPAAAVIAYEAKKKFGSDVIWYMHHPDKDLYNIHTEKGGFLSRLTAPPIRWKDRKVYKGVDKVFVNSRNTLNNQVRECYNDLEGAEVLYPPINVYPESESQGGYAFAISRVSPFKQLEIGINAISRLTDSINLKIAGSIKDEKYKAELENLSNKLNIEVEFLGYIPEEELVQHIRNCRFGIYTSQDEDFGLVPLEFLSSGKVCFTPNSSGASELIPEEYTYLDSADLAEKIEGCSSFNDYTLRDKINRINREHFLKIRKYIRENQRRF